VAEEMHPVEPDAFPNGSHLVNEGVHDPQRRIIRMIGLSATELVVEDDRSTLVGQSCQVFQIVVRKTWSAMENQQRKLPADRV
jgi:hypothetical protein